MKRYILLGVVVYLVGVFGGAPLCAWLTTTSTPWLSLVALALISLMVASVIFFSVARIVRLLWNHDPHA